MPYIEENKKQGIKEDYIPDWKQKIEVKPFQAKKIPWLNDISINQGISVET